MQNNMEFKYMPPVSPVNKEFLIKAASEVFSFTQEKIFFPKKYKLTAEEVKGLQKVAAECRERIKFYKKFFLNKPLYE